MEEGTTSFAERRGRRIALAVAATIAFACGWAALAVRVYGSYGWALFLATPGVAGAMLGVLLRRADRRIGFGEAAPKLLQVFALTLLLLFVVGFEGAICIAFVAPFVLVTALLGLAVGTAIRPPRRAPTSAAGLLLLPLASAMASMWGAHAAERALRSPPALREVRTAVVVAAPITRVWDVVVGFPRIEARPDWLSRLGLAYPVEAILDGAGVGAVRRCVFSTGAFVEPITRWEPPHLLAFDVEASPPPMKELSFHDHVDAPHLSGAFAARRGQFVLRELPDGKVSLEGTTWYSHDLGPGWYWGPITDRLIHRIHRRVLDHIAAVAVAP